MTEAELRGLKRLLEEVDGHLGLAIHRNEGSTERWKEEAKGFRRRIDAAVTDLLPPATPQRCPAKALMKDEHWGGIETPCDFDEGHAGEHGHAMTATEPEGAMLRWKGTT